jgi:DNA-binding MarR family transcriptional regulator
MTINLKKYPDASILQELQTAFPTADPIDLGFWMRLMRFMEKLMRGLEIHYSQWGISRGRFLILVILADSYRSGEQGVIPSVLADKLDVSRGNMTGLIEALLKCDLIHKRKDEKDRRVVYLTISITGLALIQKILPLHMQIVTEAIGGVTAEEKKVATAFLDKMYPGLERLRAKV